MNTANKNSDNDSTKVFIESLCYDSKLFDQKFEIDAENNLHITGQSSTKNRNEIIPLDLIHPKPVKKQHLNKPLMLLALASALASGAFFASAIFMGQLWAVTFALIIWAFGIATLFTSYKNRTTIYQFKSANTDNILFTLSEPASHNDEVASFVDSLNKRIINLRAENNKKGLSYVGASLKHDNEEYLKEKKSQYITHIDFLFNHGIIDEILYKRLSLNVDLKIFESENRFIKGKPDAFNKQNLQNNIINFPINA